MTIRVCNRCVAMVYAIPSTMVRLINDGNVDINEWNELSNLFNYRTTVPTIVDAFKRAFEKKIVIEINGYIVDEPMTTWNGDDVCGIHLIGLYQRDNMPQTVKMAQWR